MGYVVLAEVCIFVIILFTYVFWKRWRYIPTGKAKGICIKVETEISKIHREYNDGHTDNRMYRPLIQYTYDGQTYVAKSVIAYNNPVYFPGDEVTILVNNRNKEVVRILSKAKTV